MKNREIWFFLFILGTLLFNWPFLYIFNMALPFYLITAWGFFILVVGVIVTLSDKIDGDKSV